MMQRKAINHFQARPFLLLTHPCTPFDHLPLATTNHTALPSKKLETFWEKESTNLCIAEKRRAELNKYIRQLTAVRDINSNPVFVEFVQVMNG